MTINQSFQNWTIITDEPGEELVFEHEDPETGQKDRFVLTEEAGLGTETDPLAESYTKLHAVADGDGPLAQYRDPDTGAFVVDNFDTIQGAIDAIPVNDDNISGEGAVVVPSSGTQNPRGTGDATAYEENIIIDKKTAVEGLHQHAKIYPDTSEPAVDITVEEVRFNGWWVDNPSGTAINVDDSESGIKDVVIDRAGDTAIDYNGHEMQFLGPNVEVKSGPTQGIAGNDYLHATDINIEQTSSSQRIQTGMTAGTGSALKGITIFMSRDVLSCKTGIKTVGENVSINDVWAQEPKSSELSGTTTGPIQAVDVATDNNSLANIRSRNCTQTVLISNAVSGNHISGPLNDGIQFDADATQNVIDISGGGGISETTAGYANLNVINGLGWDSTSGSPPTVADWDWRPGVTVWDRDTDSYYQLNGDASAFTAI